MTRSASSGVALIAVLWVLALLSVLAAAVVVGGRTDIALAGNLAGAARAQALPDGAVRRVALALADQARQRRSRRDEDEVADEAPLDTTLTLDILIEKNLQWPVDATPVALEVGDETVIVEAQDEGGLIDVGTASETLVAGLFRAVGVEDAEAVVLAAAIAEFVDTDDDVRSDGAEAFHYRAAGLPEPTNQPFQALEEVLAVLGMSHELYLLIAPAITVYSKRPGIDPAVAPPLALSALDDYVPTESPTDRATIRSGDPTDPQLLDVDRNTRRSRGRVFRIRATATLASGAEFIREAVIRLGGRGAPYTVVRWRHGLGAADPS